MNDHDVDVESTPGDPAARIADLEAQLKAAALKALRAQIALESGLPPKLAARLHGETEADLRRDADDLRAFVARSTTTPVPGGPAAGETDAQRRARLFGGAAMFTGGGVVYNHDPADLDQPL